MIHFLGANAIVVVAASGVSAILITKGIKDKLSLTGDIQAGLPPVAIPKFSVTNGNVTITTSELFAVGYNFTIPVVIYKILLLC